MQKISWPRLWPALALLSTLGVGLYLRLAPLMQRDYWYDEAFTGITVRQSWEAMMDIIVHDVHPPLYYALLKVWTFVAGSDPFAIRLFSVIFGVALIAMVFVALRQWCKKSWIPAAVGALVVAINPFFVNYSQEARMYSLLAFLLVLAAMLFVRSWQSQSVGMRVAYGVTLLAIMLTHYLGAVFVIGFVLADAWQHWRNSPSLAKVKTHVHWLLSGYLVPLIGGLAWLPSFRMQTAAHGSLGWVADVTFDRLSTSFHIFLFGAPVGVSGVPPALGYRWEWLTVPAVSLLLTVALTALVTWLTIRKKWDAVLVFVGFMTLFPLFAALLLQLINVQLYVERFLTGSAVFLVLFTVLALSRVGKNKLLVGVASVYVVLIALIQPHSYSLTFGNVAEHVAAIPNHGEVVFTNAYDFVVGGFYVGEEATMRLYNVANVQENFDSWAVIRPDSQLMTLPSTPHIVVTQVPSAFPGYREVTTVNGYTLLQAM